MKRTTLPRRTALRAALYGICVAAQALGQCLAAAADAEPSLRARAAAQAAPSATLTAAFEPERLGGHTTLSFGFQLRGGAGFLPPALAAITLSYPNHLGIALSGLGFATCTAATVEASGLPGCPQNSIMGFGSAIAEISLGSDIVGEPVPITILRAPNEEGHISLLFSAVGSTPLNASVVFAGALLPAPAPFGEQMSIEVPLIPSVPGAPDISIVGLHATLGPKGVAYYKPIEGRTIVYQPPGLLLPPTCPRGGFPFAAQFSFLDGSHTQVRTNVPCRRAA